MRDMKISTMVNLNFQNLVSYLTQNYGTVLEKDTDVLSHIYHLGIGEQFDYCDPSGRVRFIKLNNDFWESQINERFEPKEIKYKRG